MITINSTAYQQDLDHSRLASEMSATQRHIMSAQAKVTGVLAAAVFALAMTALFVPAHADEIAGGKQNRLVSTAIQATANLSNYSTLCGIDEHEKAEMKRIGGEYFRSEVKLSGRTKEELRAALDSTTLRLYASLVMDYKQKANFCRKMSIAVAKIFGQNT